MKKTKFLAIEGGEGSGKSTLLKILKEKLNDSLLITREPGGSPYGEAIRELALRNPLAKDANAETMLCLMFAARFDHINNLIKPALDKGQHVVTDRFDASSYTYQIHAQQAPQIEPLFWNLRSSLPIIPDIYIYIDVDVEEGLKRANSRNSFTNEGNHFDGRKIDFHKRIRQGYSEFFKKTKHIIINANRPLEDVKNDFLITIDSLLN